MDGLVPAFFLHRRETNRSGPVAWGQRSCHRSAPSAFLALPIHDWSRSALARLRCSFRLRPVEVPNQDEDDRDRDNDAEQNHFLAACHFLGCSTWFHGNSLCRRRCFTKKMANYPGSHSEPRRLKISECWQTRSNRGLLRFAGQGGAYRYTTIHGNYIDL